jgi:mono/diheme cytochrome c family protein
MLRHCASPVLQIVLQHVANLGFVVEAPLGARIARHETEMAALIVRAASLCGPLAAPIQDTKTVWNGVYTDAQAAQGRAQYEETCSRCHAADLSGNVGGSLKGDVFIRDWGGKTLSALFERMKTTMPRGAPGSLSDGAYLSIVTYVLKVNGFPADPMVELKPDLLQTIRVESKEGPGYIPTGALVDSVGCLSQGPDKVWMLTNATEVARVAEAGSPTIGDAERCGPEGTRQRRIAAAVHIPVARCPEGSEGLYERALHPRSQGQQH